MMIGKIIGACLIFAAFVSAQPAAAEWREASSDHFVIYADDSEKDLRMFAQRLEHFHSALEVLLNRKAPALSPSNRLTIFVVGSRRRVRDLHLENNSQWLRGFYRPRALGSVAVVDRLNRDRESTAGLFVLLNNYVRHFTLSQYDFALPAWVSVGMAEFFSTVEFGEENLEIGKPAVHRAFELLDNPTLHVKHLLDPERHGEKPWERDGFYGKSWSLYHYLLMDDARPGQLDSYLTAITEGVEMGEAARRTFGDFGKLEREVNNYMRQRRLAMWQLPLEKLPVSQITVRELREGEAAIMPLIIRSQVGVDQDLAIEVVAETREIAARYPDDPAVLTQLAEAEYDAGNDAEAIAAADRAIAIDPVQKNAYVQKGLAMFRQAAEAEGREKAFREARAPFIALNRIENDHPIPLIYFHRSFIGAGIEPSEIAVQGLGRAVTLAPFDHRLRMLYAVTLANMGQPEQAKREILPVAHNPYGGVLSQVANDLLMEINTHLRLGKRSAMDIDLDELDAQIAELVDAESQDEAAD